MAVCGAVFAPAVAAETAPAPPYIAGAAWVSYDGLPTLRVYLTQAGRQVAGDFGKSAAETGEAWREVLGLAPDADSPGMQAQFLCHWNFAEFAEPGKPSWDLEPWRPDVGDGVMVLTGCNPGGPELG